jgi:hypothetical protein
MKISMLALLLCYGIMLAQTGKQNIGISFSGFVKTDMMYDTRQTVTLREGHFLLYPQSPKLDTNGKDINAKSNFNILSIQTRLLGKITGPDAFDAKTSGLLEGEFFGTSDADVNAFRLRHAFVKFDWANTSVLVGQTWHPMFVMEMFPGVVSFNTGVPFQPFSRNPQIRLTHSFEEIKLILCAAAQRDFQSNGPGGSSSLYLRNSVIPNIHAQVQFMSNGNLAGAGFDYKILTPRLVTTKNIKTDASVSGISALGYIKRTIDPVTIKLQGIYGQNISDLMHIGGYAVRSTDAITGAESYTPLSTVSVWGDVSIGKITEYALFAGYSKSLGASNTINGAYYGRGTDIDNVFRVSPRVQFNAENVRVSTEIEYTSSGYGTPNNTKKGKIDKVTTVSNVRLLLALFYYF